MSDAVSAQRLAENEVVFRQHNERIQQGLKKLIKNTQKEDRDLLGDNLDMPLHFFCECSDETCDKRIIVKPSQYKKLHKNNSQFLILPGHQVASIEKIISKTPKYTVVKKIVPVPKKAKKLNKTEVYNS